MRRLLPRKTALATLPSGHFRALISAYNSTPRKCLDFKTPQRSLPKCCTSNVNPPSRFRGNERMRGTNSHITTTIFPKCSLARIVSSAAAI
jgi:hypothetical protein